jgi:C4-dicarboxylate-specific signal transduction histidine kinase
LAILRRLAPITFILPLIIFGWNQPALVLAGGLLLGLFLSKLFPKIGWMEDKGTKEEQTKMAFSAKMASLGMMAMHVAHEVNNPLAIILCLADEIESPDSSHEVPSEVTKFKAKKIAETSLRAARVLQGLLKIGRAIETSPKSDESLKSIVEGALIVSRPRTHREGVRLEIDAIDENMQIHCNSQQISLVLINLIANSLDALQESDEKWIHVKLTHTRNSVILSIVDSGHGVPEHIEEKIMNPFITSKPIGKGSGLSLSISKQIVEDHGGLLSFVKNCKNTTFSMSLPLCAAAERLKAS